MKKRPAKKRKPRYPHAVCKPCWELKYCPYGPLVEFFPLLSDAEPDKPGTIERSNKHWKRELRQSLVAGDNSRIYRAIQGVLFSEPGQWARLRPYRTDELSCNVFGHICPVFLSFEGLTETREGRSVGRAIPRAVMLKVVRRDGQMCQKCGKNVPDREIEFDHLIPKARGGANTTENLRVLCRACNRKKGDALSEILDRGEE
jgi:5-methylcytosine-specific restriction endonuclease McrA